MKLTVAALLLSALGAQAQDSLYTMTSMWHDLPEAEVRAVGLAAGAQGADEVAGALTVLTARELQRFQYADPMQVLRGIAGVNLQEEDGFGLRPNIGLRGSGAERSTRITLMEDGVLAAPAPYSAPAAYYFPSIARMSSVEVMKGSSQIAFGPATSGGALNLVSTAIPEAELAGRVALEAGAFGGQRTQLMVGGTRAVGEGNLAYLVEFLGQSSDGFKTVDNGAPNGFQKDDRLLKLAWQPDAARDQRWLLKVGDVREISHETYLGLSDADFAATPYRRYAASAEDVMHADQTQFNLSHEVRIGRWESTTTLYHNTFNRNWYKLDGLRDSTGASVSLVDALEAPGSAAYTLLTGRTSVGLEQLEVKANNRVYYSEGLQHRGSWTFGEPLRLTYGVRAHRDGMDRFQWVDGYAMEEGQMFQRTTGTPGGAGNRIDGAEALAGFARATVKAGPWTFTPGLRHEAIRMQRESFSDPDREQAPTVRTNDVAVWLPGLGVTKALREDMTAFAGLHRGFIPPGSAPGTEPERSWNGELGLRLSRDGFSGQFVAYHTAFGSLLGSDLAAAGGTGSGDAFNGGSAAAQGVEVEFAWDPLRTHRSGWALPIRGAYTYTHAVFTESFESAYEPWGLVDSGDFMPYLAPHTASLGATLEKEGLHFDVNARYTAAMRTEAGIGEAGLWTDEALVVDAGVRGVLGEHLEVRAAVTNVADAVYSVARRPYGLRPGAPRMLRVGCSWAF